MKKNLMMAGCLLVAACAVAAQTADAKAAAAAAKAAEKAAKAAEKARNDKFKALKKECEALVRKDFKGGFANYWHDSIDAARAKYEAALKDDFTLQQMVELYARIAQCRLEATRDVEGAMKDLDAAIALAGSDEQAKATAEANKARLVAQLDGTAFGEKPVKKTDDNMVDLKIEELFRQGGLAKVKAELPAYLVAEQKVADADTKARRKARRYLDAWRSATKWTRGRETNGLLQQPGAREFFVELMEKIAPAEQRPGAKELFEFTRNVPALAAKRVEYAKGVLELAKEPKNKINAKLAKEAAFFIAYESAKGDPAKLIAAFTSTNKVEMAEDLAQAARLLLKQGDEAGARTVWAKRTEIVPPLPEAVLDVPYWANGPHDIRGILASETYRKAKKGYLNRRYGDNLKFLIETDSAILGREMTTDKGETFKPTEIFAYWDAEGVKILLRAYADNMDAVRAGFAKLGGYESYLATGIDDPYHSLMVGTSEGDEVGDNFVTQYDNVTGYRQVRRKDGTLTYQNLYLEDGGATLLSVPWSAAYTAVPWLHPDWFFEPIHWAHGGMSWGGSKSVHNRSSFGRLHFTGVDAKSTAAVKRRLLPKAKAVFSSACNARAAGEVERWSDPVLGDQAFYLAEVKPLVDRIKPMMDLVKADMSDADAVKAWDAAGEDAMNLNYLVSLKRTQWLKAKRLKGKTE